MKRRVVAAMLIVSMTATMLMGCGGDTKEEQADSKGSVSEDSIVTEPTELTFIFADGDENAKEAKTEIVNRFNEQYEDITITIKPGNGDTYSEILKTQDSIGEFPDVLETANAASYVRAGKLAPLPEDIVELFASPVEIEGDVYTVSDAGANTTGFFYNKAYFDENNLEEPETYDEFIELCEKIEELGDMSPLVVGGQDIWHMGFLFNQAYMDNVISQDEDFIAHCYEGTKDFSDDTFQAAFEEVQEIMQYAQDGWSSTPDAQITTFLVSDMSAMLYSGGHMIKSIHDADPEFELGWFPLPAKDGKLRLVGGSMPDGLAISAEAAEDPNKKAAAEEFIRFFFNDENYKYYCEVMNVMPVTKEDPGVELDALSMEIVEAVESADYVNMMWNNQVGDNELPADFRNFTYKTLIEVLQGTRDMDSASEELNKTWDVSIQSFNPLTGVGLE